jgi:hypothetical protein
LAKLFHKLIHWRLIFVKIKNNSVRKRYQLMWDAHPELLNNAQKRIGRAIQNGKPVSKRDRNHLEKLQYQTEWLIRDIEKYEESWNLSFSDLVMDKVNIEWLIKHPWKKGFEDIPYYDRMVKFLETYNARDLDYKEQIRLYSQSLKIIP